MPKVSVSQLKCCLKSCDAKATHLCDKCMCVGYCCSACRTKDKNHASMCKRLTKSVSRTKTKSKKKTKSKSRN